LHGIIPSEICCTGLPDLAECCKPAVDAGGLPESKLAILAEGFVVERAQLAEVKGSSTSFIPASVRSFAHSRAKWGLANK